LIDSLKRSIYYCAFFIIGQSPLPDLLYIRGFLNGLFLFNLLKINFTPHPKGAYFQLLLFSEPKGKSG